jgi:chitinase
MHNHPMPTDGMTTEGMMEMGPVPSNSGELQASVAGNLYSGGMGGTLTLSNASNVALKDWSFGFLTNQPDFESWSAESSVNDLGGGVYQVLITPPAWGLEIPAAGSVDLSFNANSVGLPDSGELTNALFFVAASGADVVAPEQAAPIVEPLPVVEVTPVVEPSPVIESSPLMADSQGLSVSATITGGWSGVFAGRITVTNLGNGSAGTDWRVAVVMDAPLTSVSNFDVQSELRSDGRYDVLLSPKSWAAPLDPGDSQSSYYQAAGEATNPAEVFDFVDVAVSETAETADMPDSSAVSSEQIDSVMDAVMDSPIELTASNESVASLDVQAPNGGSDKRIVTYFEEWGVYERDINLSDVNGQAMTHLNYSFFDVKAPEFDYVLGGNGEFSISDFTALA